MKKLLLGACLLTSFVLANAETQSGSVYISCGNLGDNSVTVQLKNAMNGYVVVYSTANRQGTSPSYDPVYYVTPIVNGKQFSTQTRTYACNQTYIWIATAFTQ